MKKTFLFAALAIGLVACSSEETTETGDTSSDGNVEQSEGGENDEITRLREERDMYFDLKTEAAGEMDTDKMNMYQHKMDSVDALYQEALRN